MRRLVLRVAVGFLAVLAIASSAAAVQISVKAPTKLYGSDGKPITDVTAGLLFQAERIQGDWVYGFLPTKSGGARGWISAAALDLDDETRRLLEPAAGKTAEHVAQPDQADPPAGSEPILLRYRLGKDQTQAYDTVNDATISLTRTEAGRTESVDMMRLWARVGVTYQGKGRDDDGLILAAPQVRRIELRIGRREMGTGAWTEQRLDHEGMKVYDGAGHLLRPVRYGEGEFADAPGVNWLLDNPYDARITDRLEFRDAAFTLDGGDYTLEAMGGVELKGLLSGGFSYPEDPIKPGDSWEQQATQELRQPLGASMPAKLSGRTRYTFEGRTTYHDRPALKIRITGRFDPPRNQAGIRIDGAIEGTALIDEATGIR
ncbi:MAG TPA: hypothetical protein VFH61_15110, partial [Thermoleophilia bacterium]|nr:hypothetical protein [Thermoleophilia bacterium]